MGTIKEFKEKMTALRSVTPWEDVLPEEEYHIPPIVSLERREIVILGKNGNSATYRRIGDKENNERTMHQTSVFAKFLVKKKKF